MLTTMPTTQMQALNLCERVRRRRRPIVPWKTRLRAAVTIAVPVAILSHVGCGDFFPAINVDSPALFVTGLTISNAGIIRNAIIPNPNQNYMKSPHSSRSSPYRGRKGMCLYESVSFSDENSSVVLLQNATTNQNEKTVSVTRDGNEGNRNGLLMNPMEDFGTTSKFDTMGFDDEYKRGLLTIGFITFLFATNSPVLHWAFTSGENPPPVLLVNAAVSVVALVGLLLGGDTLEETGALPSDDTKENKSTGWVGGLELGMWKFLGTTANLFGLALTTASHGALLIQLTTLIVPTTRAFVYKESISTKLKLSIGLALSGVVCFANDPTGTPSFLGDALCVVAAVCYSAYDLRLYEYGKVVDAVKPLITTKIATQALFSIGLLFLAPTSLLSEGATAEPSSWQESYNYLQKLLASSDWLPVATAVLWSGVAVNAVAPFLQVGGQQIVGPTKCQTIYASQPLWAAILSYVFLGERLGLSGAIGGSAFLVALALAATAENGKETKALASTTQLRESTTLPKVQRSNATVATIEIETDSGSYRS